jgi:hypothetical protein
MVEEPPVRAKTCAVAQRELIKHSAANAANRNALRSGEEALSADFAEHLTEKWLPC